MSPIHSVNGIASFMSGNLSPKEDKKYEKIHTVSMTLL